MSISESKIRQIIREETKRVIREASIKGGTFVPRHGVDISGVKPGDRIPASWFNEPSMSPEEGPGARAAMRMREPEIRSVGNPEYLRSKFGEEGDNPDYFDDEESSDEELDEAKKKYKASSGTLAAFKKGAKGKKGGERKKRHAGFDAAKKSAEKWADEPAAVAQAATIKATGKPVVAKGEKRKIKESEDRDSSGDYQEPWDERKPTFMNRKSVDRYDPDMGYDAGSDDSTGHVDPDELSDDPFYSRGHRVKEQKYLNFYNIVKESDDDTFMPHDFSGNKRMRLSRLTNRFEPLDIDSSGEDRPVYDPDIDYETGLPYHKPGGGDTGGDDNDLSEHGRATFRKIVKEETLKFLRNRR